MIESNIIKGFKISCKKAEELKTMAQNKGKYVSFGNPPITFLEIYLKDFTHYIIIFNICKNSIDQHTVIYSESLR